MLDLCSLHTFSRRVIALIIFPWHFYEEGYDILDPFPLATGQLKFLIVAVQYFTKWVEIDDVPQITAERVRCCYWRNNICHFGLPGIVVSDNGIQFASLSVVEFCRNLDIQNHFIYVDHPQDNGQAKAANKIILSGMKKNLDEANGLWAEYLHEILWSYHTPHYSTTKQTPFRMVYMVDAMILVEFNTPTQGRTNFDNNLKKEGLYNSVDLIEEIKRMTHVRGFVVK